MRPSLSDLRALAVDGALPFPAAAIHGLPSSITLPPPEWDRVEGMLLGLAIGDSLGNTSKMAL